MSEEKKIYEALAGIMDDVQAVSKSQRNVKQGYQYRGIDDVVNMIHPHFAKWQVFLTSEVLSIERTERRSASGGVLLHVMSHVRYTFHAVDGSFVQTTVYAEGMDSGDKATNKALSAALKYALGQSFLIPYQMVDSETDDHEVKPKSSGRFKFPEQMEDKSSDGPDAPGLTMQHIKEINSKLQERKVDGLKFWDWACSASKVSNINEIPDRFYGKLIDKINEKKAQHG